MEEAITFDVKGKAFVHRVDRLSAYMEKQIRGMIWIISEKKSGFGKKPDFYEFVFFSPPACCGRRSPI